MKVIAFGSCLSNLTVNQLKEIYGWRQTHAIHSNRSDQVVSYFIDGNPQIPLSFLEELIVYKPEDEVLARQVLYNQYPKNFGFHNIDNPFGRTFLEDLQSNQYDCILLDNLMDLVSLLMYPKDMPEFHGPGISLMDHMYLNGPEIHQKFGYGSYLTAAESVENWIKIIKWLKVYQPAAKFFFLSYHYSTSLNSPDRYARIRSFYETFEPWALTNNISLIPPLNLPDNFTNGESDWPHFKDNVYKAIAGYIFLQAQGGLPKITGRSSGVPYPDFFQFPPKVEHKKTSEPSHPYLNLPKESFWKSGVANVPYDSLNPVIKTSFSIAKDDKVTPVGSCFAQHISKSLMTQGFNYFVTEAAPLSSGALDENYTVFPARFGNVYTIRQMLQLFQRSMDIFRPRLSTWRTRSEGSFVDPFRPNIQRGGFISEEALLADRAHHLDSVKRMFSECDVFIFTMGLTEAWVSRIDQSVVPLAPGVSGGNFADQEFFFKNFGYQECFSDLIEFIDELRVINPTVKIILTVSPVPLVATYEKRHVLVSTAYSKAVLRAVASDVVGCRDNVDYFPSYEIITANSNCSRYFESNLREINAAGVSHVMSVFASTYLNAVVNHDKINSSVDVAYSVGHSADQPSVRDIKYFISELNTIVCDEESLDPSKSSVEPDKN